MFLELFALALMEFTIMAYSVLNVMYSSLSYWWLLPALFALACGCFITAIWVEEG